MNLYDIFVAPTDFGLKGGKQINEQLFRSYHIVNKIIEMVDRGDSKETINEVVALLRSRETIKYETEQ